MKNALFPILTTVLLLTLATPALAQTEVPAPPAPATVVEEKTAPAVPTETTAAPAVTVPVPVAEEKAVPAIPAETTAAPATTAPAAAEEKAAPTTEALQTTVPDHLKMIEQGTVKEVLKADMVLLDNNKRYKFDNIRIPPDYNQPVLDEVTAALLNKHVTIYTSSGKAEPESDRYGIPLVHVITDDSLWIQTDLISKGIVWAFGSETSRRMVPYLSQVEQEARLKKQGFWANAFYMAKSPNSVKKYINSFQIVEGVIQEVSVKKEFAFLNFGKDYKTDFTIRIPKPSLKLFSTDRYERFDPTPWKGKTVRIRGWVEDKDGPMIELTYPEQMEFVKK